jgi:hypothetical protein
VKKFKDAVDNLINRWDLLKQELQKTFQETYLQLENQLLIKYLQSQQIALQTSRLHLSIIARDLKKLKIKKNELRQRLTSLIGAEKLSGKLDPNTDEYIFPSELIEEAYFERPPAIITSTETPPPSLKNSLWDRTVDIFKKWYPIVGSLGSIGTITVLVAGTGNLLAAILIPSIILPALFIYVLYSHFSKKKEET